MDEPEAHGSRIGTWMVLVIVLVALAAVADLGAQLVVGLARAAAGPSDWMAGLVSGLVTAAALLAAVVWWRSRPPASHDEEDGRR